jgi:hypothetical protein
MQQRYQMEEDPRNHTSFRTPDDPIFLSDFFNMLPRLEKEMAYNKQSNLKQSKNEEFNKPNKKTFMQNIVNFAKHLTMSADQKLLLKHGLKDECGNYTESAERLIMDKMIKDNEEYLVAVATAKESEDKK